MTREGQAVDNESGFTLTELLVALVLASGIFVAMAELSRHLARALFDVTQSVERAQAFRLGQSVSEMLARADPGNRGSSRTIGETVVVETIVGEQGGEVHIVRDGSLIAILTTSVPSEHSSVSWRTIGSDCYYDLIARRCRE